MYDGDEEVHETCRNINIHTPNKLERLTHTVKP